jgi:phosphohistidine swiveling domain-containing protein
MARWVLWLDEITADQLQMVGGKAASLGSMLRAGFRVPPGFCVTTAAYRAFVAGNDLEAEIEALAGGGTADPYALFDRPMDEALEREILAARDRLLGILPKGSRVAVRSSATIEDLADASFAGQGETSLNVGPDEVLDRIRECWASLWAARAVSYRSSKAALPHLPEMAVVVQAMIPCDAGGVAFSADPMGGEGIVIEAVEGLAEAVVQGTGEITRYTVNRHDQSCRQEGKDILTLAQIRLVAEAALALEAHFGSAQDVEWGLWDEELYLFQCRAVTTEADQFFTQLIPGDDYLWTAGYLNERFSQPVSPLGWSVVGDLTEGLAFRDPLRYLGYRSIDRLPITKLYRGHPYTNVAVFQILYKVFPDALVPGDAGRYFPGGDTGLRKQAPYPCCLLDPRFVISMLVHFVREPANWSPLHNYRHWARFEARLETGMETLRRQMTDAADLDELVRVIKAAQRWSRELLGIHRWSLMAADLAVPLLGRLVGCWVSKERQAELSARLLAGLPNKSVELDQALRRLAASADPEGEDLAGFLATYGHRSFSLDIYCPTFADEPEQVLRLLEVAGQGPDPVARVAEREAAEDAVRAAIVAQPVGWLKWLTFDQVLGLARRYVRLREDQRFAWQRILALIRRAFVRMGEEWVADGVLVEGSDVFFATLEEIGELVQPAEHRPDAREELRQTVTARRVTFERLQREFELAPHLTYPAFLRGNRPLEIGAEPKAGRWHGIPVSPGLVRGAVRVVLTPGQFERVAPGDILVTRSTDPGWTPIFGQLGGLIMEQGGQLSHGSVVAREYGLPAVVSIPQITEQLRDGDQVLLDGMSGTVALEITQLRRQ